MAFDGITIAEIVHECSASVAGGRIYKITQPEPDEIILTIRSFDAQYNLFISADASLPLIYLTQERKIAPVTAPNFCMVLRKYLQNGKITAVRQPGLERVVCIETEHMDDMGDMRHLTLNVEIMGKCSNIILCDEHETVIDSIKHVTFVMSSVREVLPGRKYFIPETEGKSNPLTADFTSFSEKILKVPAALYKSVYSSYTGISPLIANEICHMANLEPDQAVSSFDSDSLRKLFEAFSRITDKVRTSDYSPRIYYENDKPVEYSSFPLTIYDKCDAKVFDAISPLLAAYYSEKNHIACMRQKSTDLRRIVQSAIERDVRKYDLQQKQMKDTEKRDKYRIYGEMLNTYGYSIPENSESAVLDNYHTGEKITVPLDPMLTPQKNAEKYFDRYQKLKRTYEALEVLTKEVRNEIEHLESVNNSLDIARTEDDLVPIREELVQSGYIKKKTDGKPAKKVRTVSRPFHYKSSDGFDIFVGKNNFQNDDLTFRLSDGNDWWFHAKKIPGSHVILKTEGREMTDNACETAARLAAHYSKGASQQKVEVDYTLRKNIKKPGGAKPGFVVYYTNYSVTVSSDIEDIRCEDQ